MDDWFSYSLDKLVATNGTFVPICHTSPKSKTWWTPPLAASRKTYAKAARAAREKCTEEAMALVSYSRRGYFKAIIRAKKTMGPVSWLTPPPITSGRPGNLLPHTRPPDSPPYETSVKKTPYVLLRPVRPVRRTVLALIT